MHLTINIQKEFHYRYSEDGSVVKRTYFAGMRTLVQILNPYTKRQTWKIPVPVTQILEDAS